MSLPAYASGDHIVVVIKYQLSYEEVPGRYVSAKKGSAVRRDSESEAPLLNVTIIVVSAVLANARSTQTGTQQSLCSLQQQLRTTTAAAAALLCRFTSNSHHHCNACAAEVSS